MTFTDAIRSCLTKYTTLTGRAPRAEYWWFSVPYVAVALAVGGIVLLTDAPLLGVLALPLVPPMLAVSVRRLHDTGRSGWWMLIALVPVVGPVAYLALMTVPSTAEPTQYGAALGAAHGVAGDLPNAGPGSGNRGTRRADA